MAARAADQHLAVTDGANMAAQASSQALTVDQQRLVANLAWQRAQDISDKFHSEIPEAKAAVTEARFWAIEAQRHAEHAKAAAAALKNVPAEAAERAAKAIQAEIKAMAYSEAERAGTPPADAAAIHARKVVASVAAAMQPYHLATLRAQKETATSYSKAQRAQASSVRLSQAAQAQAANAQSLQATGHPVQAMQAMAQAHATMRQAADLRTWAQKFYEQASANNGVVGQYALGESQAAARAVALSPAVSGPTVPPLNQ